MTKRTRKLLRSVFGAISLAIGLTVLALATAADTPAAAQPGACAPEDVAVGIYQGWDTVDPTFESRMQGDVVDPTVPPPWTEICAKTIDKPTWQLMTASEFAEYDVLWIGNDRCSAAAKRSDLQVAIDTIGTWETVVDPGNVMIAGGDFDLHYEQGVIAPQSPSDNVVKAMLRELSDGPVDKVGLVLQAGCYVLRNEPWFQDLGSSFDGLAHNDSKFSDPSSMADIYANHQFNIDNSFEWHDWYFGNTCHGGVAITPGSAVERTYNLQPVFKHTASAGVDCFYMSDENKPPSKPCSSLDTYFLIDDSGSMTSAEVAAAADLANSIQSGIHGVLPDSRFGVARYGGLSQTETVLYIEHDLSAAPVPVSSERLVPFTSDDHLADAVRAFQTSLSGVPAELQAAPASPSPYDQFTGWDEDVPKHLVIISDGMWDSVDESTMRDYSSSAGDFLAYDSLKENFEISLILDETNDPGGFEAERASIPTMGGSWTGGASNSTPDPRRLYLKADHAAGPIVTDIVGNLSNCREIPRSGPAD